MEAKIFNQSGDEVGIIQLADYIFGIEPNMPVMHQAMVRQQANARLGTSNTLRRGEVQGSTRKLYKQKGTGRARAGSIRAPTARAVAWRMARTRDHTARICRARCAGWLCARRFRPSSPPTRSASSIAGRSNGHAPRIS